MANDCYTSVAYCQSCAAQGARNHHEKQLSLFPAVGTLQFLVMDNLGPLSETESGHQHLIVLTDPYKKLTMAIPLTTVTSTSAATVFVDSWAISNGILTYFLTNNGPQFVSKFFAFVTASLGIKHLTTTD